MQMTVLQILSVGGNFILKIFTFFRHETVSLLYILCAFFGHVSVTKPESSRPGNSEVCCLDLLLCLSRVLLNV